MSTNAPRPNEGTDKLQPMRQDRTRCRILGIDVEGYEHVHDQDSNRIVVLDDTGILVQYNLDALEQDASDWMHYVDDRVGWAKEQWLGYRWVEALTGAAREGEL